MACAGGFVDIFEYDNTAMEPAPKRYHSEELIDLTCQESMEEAAAESQAVVDEEPAPLRRTVGVSNCRVKFLFGCYILL